MKKKQLSSFLYIDEICGAFKKSPFAYHEVGSVMKHLTLMRHRAYEWYKEEEFYNSASFYKAIVEVCFRFLEDIQDFEGDLGRFLYRLLEEYKSSIQDLDLDFEWFCDEVIDLYLQEDYGYYYEIIHLLFSKITSGLKERWIFIEKRLNIKKLDRSLSVYKKYKLDLFLLELYHTSSQDDSYIRLCESLKGFDKYFYLGRKYEDLQSLSEAIEVYKEGIRMCSSAREYCEKRIIKIRNNLLGLGSEY